MDTITFSCLKLTMLVKGAHGVSRDQLINTEYTQLLLQMPPLNTLFENKNISKFKEIYDSGSD